MARSPEFGPVRTLAGWMVSIPKGMTATGKRVRRYFPTETLAKKFSGKMRAAHNSGLRGGLIPAALAMDAAAAAEILEGTGVSLVEAARAMKAKLEPPEAMETFGARYARALQAGEHFWSDRYMQDMTAVARFLPKWFLNLRCALCDETMVLKALKDGRSLTAATIRGRQRVISAVLGFKDRHRRKADIAILSQDKVVALLDVCATPEERWAVAILLFAGVRPAVRHGEISRLDWAAVGKRQVYLSPEVSKVGERHVPIFPRLQRELAGHPAAGAVMPVAWEQRWAAIRKAAGVTEQDICRATFCSHLLAWKGMVATQAAMGHVPMSAVTRAHYARSVTKEAGAAYFK